MNKIKRSAASRRMLPGLCWTVMIVTLVSAQQPKPMVALPPDPVLEVSATVETQPLPNAADAADDPAIWVHPSNPAASTIIGTDKKGGLAVYDLAGKQIQYLPDGRMNNVDIRGGFQLGGKQVALVTAGNRTDNSIAIYRVNESTRMLENVAARKITTLEVYGSCMYRSSITNKFYYFVNGKTGAVEQWELFDDSKGQVDAKRVRNLKVGSQPEGCVADDQLGHFYIGEENVGIWKYGAEPTSGATRAAVDKTGAGGHLTSNVEGLCIAYGPAGDGYLIASSQGNNTYVVYRREGKNDYVKTFRIVDGNGIDGTSETDGIDVTTAHLGPAFPHGLFIAQDGANNGNQNFKLVPLQLILPGAANSRETAQKLAASFYFGPSAQTRQDITNSDSRLQKLPSAMREKGSALLNEKDENRRADLAEELFDKNAAASMEFLLDVLANDPSVVVRLEIIDQLGEYSHPQVRLALERHAAIDPDPNVAVQALERLRIQRTEEMSKLLQQRMELARRTNDTAAWRLLAEEHERWISLVSGTTLPAFLRTPPPPFNVSPADRPVRVLALGDFGANTEGQKQVAAAMRQEHQKNPFDFAITLGDNFYPDGMASPSDPRWKTLWSDLYDPLGLKFYATLGNHDWHWADSPAAEILYTQQSQSWRMPSPYYTFTAGPVHFFALDTNKISELQLLWLKDALAESRARWKVVYGHHPIYSAGRHGDTSKLIEKLLPVLKGQADVYLAGHEHDMQHLKPEGGVHFFINGGGGARIRPIKPIDRSLYAQSAHGFASLEADAKKLEIKYLGTDGRQLYQYTLNK